MKQITANQITSDKRPHLVFSLATGQICWCPDSVPCIRKVVFLNEGRAILANVDLLPVLPTGIELESLMHLSHGVAQRKQLLSSLLSWYGTRPLTHISAML